MFICTENISATAHHQLSMAACTGLHTVTTSAQGGAHILAETPREVEVLPAPSYRLNGSAVARAALASTLRQVYRNRPEKIMYVAGQPGVTYETVVDAIDMATSNGVRVIGISPKSAPSRH